MTDPVRVVFQQLQSPSVGRAEESQLRLTWTEEAAQWYEAHVSSFRSFQSFRKKMLSEQTEMGAVWRCCTLIYSGLPKDAFSPASLHLLICCCS